MKKSIILVLSMLIIAFANTASSQLSGKVKVIEVRAEYGYFVVETLYSGSSHYALLELYDGSFPSLNDILVGEFRQSDEDIRNLTTNSRLWVRVLFISLNRAETIDQLNERVRTR